MRVMVIVKADGETEAGLTPDEASLAAMTRFNETLVHAGVLLAAEGLQPSSAGVRVRFDRGAGTVIDRSFVEADILVAGFWLWAVRTIDEAIEWVKRGPFDDGAEIEIRPVSETDDLRGGIAVEP
jgi:hypothetical protein